MGPISGIGGGAGFQPLDIQPSRPAAADSLRGAGDVGAVGSGASSGTNAPQGAADMFAAVTELLNSIGGGVQDDELLRLLIVLMVLMAMLENQQNQSAGGGDPLRALGGSNGETGQTISIYSSSTTISIQQTETTIFLSDTYGATDGGLDESGSTLDEIA